MKAYVFPGQGAQFIGMGQDLYENAALAKELFEQANDFLGFRITDKMFSGTEDDLKETKITQPAIFLHSVILSKVLGADFQPAMVAGHSVGELSALAAAGAISFEDGLRLVQKRAAAMQKACEENPSTMAAILRLEDEKIEEICAAIDGVVVPANYNCPGQLVISGTIEAVDEACEKLTEAGAAGAIKLKVGGAFHSPLMAPAEEALKPEIEATTFHQPICPVYQNKVGAAVHTAEELKANLIQQLTSPVPWTKTMQNMIADGCTSAIEVGPGRVLQGLFKKVDRRFPTEGATLQTV